ncbi:MAG: adenosylcobinamide-GDP ribazoletransferase [Veillonella sp.]|nr:adenosylcobinamide-GDP ribazoletransferase [Veillonella sp.]
MKPFWIALQFLTRLKIVNQTEWTVEDFGKSVLAFPAVGLIIGLFMVAVYALLESHMPHQLLMLVLVVFEFLFTGDFMQMDL